MMRSQHLNQSQMQSPGRLFTETKPANTYKENFRQGPPRPFRILSPWKTHIFWKKNEKNNFQN